MSSAIVNYARILFDSSHPNSSQLNSTHTTSTQHPTHVHQTDVTNSSYVIIDHTKPTYSAGEVTNADLNNVSLTFNDAANNLVVTDLSAGDFDIEYSADSGSNWSYLHQGSVHSGADIALNGKIIDISLNTAVNNNASPAWQLRASYTKNTTYTNQNITDQAGNTLDDFSNQSVTNNSFPEEG